MRLKFWGTRGSIPVPGKDTIKYGGNTPCVEYTSNSGTTVILDGGSGLRECGNYLLSGKIGRSFNVLLSHYHWDHIQGIPFFAPLYNSECHINFYGYAIDEMTIHNFLSHQMTWHNFPIELDRVKAKIKFIDVMPGNILSFDDIKIEPFLTNHSSPTLSYKITEKDSCVVYMTDNELELNGFSNMSLFKNKNDFYDKNKAFVDFCKGSDYLIHDSMYSSEFYPQKKGWGHSCNSALVLLGILSGIKNLVLFHYNPDDNDDKVDEMFNCTQELIAANNSNLNCIASRDGLEITN